MLIDGIKESAACRQIFLLILKQSVTTEKFGGGVTILSIGPFVDHVKVSLETTDWVPVNL